MCAAVEEREESAGREPRRGSSRKPKDAIALARPGDVEIRDLSREETEAILQRNRVGRLAFSLHDRVDIEPIHYVYERGWLYGRTSEGEKISVVKHNQWIAFEIDEVADLFDWRSVVIHDPVVFRHTLFRIAVGDARGREARMRPLERNDP